MDLQIHQPPPPPPPPAAIDAAAMQRERVARLVSSADRYRTVVVTHDLPLKKKIERKKVRRSSRCTLTRERRDEDVKEVTMELIEEAESVRKASIFYHLKLHAPGLSQELKSQTFSGEWSWANSSIGAHRFFNKGVGWNEK